MEMQRRDFTLTDTDGSQTEFTGWEIGSATSQRPGQRRWTEVHIFRTVGDNYVVQKVGKSAVEGEVDRPTLHVSTAPEGAVESCKTSDGDGALFFTRVAREALEQAVGNDDELLDAYMHRKLA